MSQTVEEAILPGFICSADYAAAVFHSVFARLRQRLAEAKSRLRRDEDWWAISNFLIITKIAFRCGPNGARRDDKSFVGCA